MRATRSWRAIAGFLGVLAVTAARPAAAETLSLMWDPSPDSSVVGYLVYVGTQPGSPSNSYDVGKTQSFEWNGAIDGQQYYFSVAAYKPGPVVGVRSPEVPRYPNLPPTLNYPGNQTTTIGSNVALQLVGSDPEGNVLSFGASGLPPGLQLTTGTGLISGSPSTAGSYTVTATVTDGVLSDARTFSWAVVQQTSGDGGTGPTTTQPSDHGTTSPSTTNLAPTLADPGTQAATTGISVALQLTGSDPEGAALTYGVSGLPPGLHLNAGSGRISGTPSTAGRYVVTATVTDGALSAARTFTWNVVQSSTDIAPPEITITLPTTASTFQTDQQILTLGGTALDDDEVSTVSWKTDRGLSGTASGTQTWIAGVPLLGGSNTITVTARDRSGNVATRSVLVNLHKATKAQRGPRVRIQTQTD